MLLQPKSVVYLHGVSEEVAEHEQITYFTWEYEVLI